MSVNSARYILFTSLSGDSFILFKLFYRISQTSSKCGHSLNIVEMKKDGGGGGMEQITSTSVADPGEGPGEPPPSLSQGLDPALRPFNRKKKEKKICFPL